MEKEIETIKAKLKFEKSSRTNLWVGFISINTANGYIKGVRATSKEPKKVCVVSSALAPCIQKGVLYDVEMIPTKKKTGYVVISAVPHTFEAVLDSSIIHNAVYNVRVKFGNRVIIYDPLDGYNDSMRTISGCIKVLEKRKDISNLPEVIEEFTKLANIVLTTFENDGYYVQENR